MALWSEEKVKYASDDARLSVLCQHLSDANDILAGERLTDLSGLDIYLLRKYGSQSIILVSLLKDIVKNNKPPRTDIEEEISCNRLRSVTPFIITTENYNLISHTQLTDLVNITFQKETKSSFWERFFALKETSTNDYLGIHPEVSANEVDEIFETDYGRQKIFLLNNFTDRRIEVLRQTNPSSSRDDCGSGGYGGNCGSGKGGRGLSKVTDQREKYSCPLCATKIHTKIELSALGLVYVRSF